MLNGSLKSQALSALKASQAAYEAEAEKVAAVSGDLHGLRMRSSEVVIPAVEAFVNALANTPKEFSRAFAEYRAEFKSFTEAVVGLEAQSAEANFKAGSTAAAGVAAGVGTAALAPTAAMAIATTFGTASTGTAISALSGAAATKAALAWLGGGALAAGGGGMAAGSSLLALAGPVGWAIGATALVGGGLMARSKNARIAQEADGHRKDIEAKLRVLRGAGLEISRLITATSQHVRGMEGLLRQLKAGAPANYPEFSEEQKGQLAALVNHVHSLSALLNKKVQ